MARMKLEDREEFLKEPITGVVATLRADGRPYTVPVWWLWKEPSFWLVGTYPRVWCKQLMKDPRMSLCIERTEPWSGHIEIDGTAVARGPHNDFDIWPIYRELAAKFVGKNDPSRGAEVDAYLEGVKFEPRVLFEVTPEVWRAIDLRVYSGKRADREYAEKMRAAGG
ncbi:MAG: pyridoxamine 5'-phosphate oxidase family protein [Tepidiformaceae bacterium]